MEYFENGVAHSYSVSTPEKNYNSQELVRGNLHNYFDNMMMAVPWNKLYKADYILDNNLRFPELKWDDLHFNKIGRASVGKECRSRWSPYH